MVLYICYEFKDVYLLSFVFMVNCEESFNVFVDVCVRVRCLVKLGSLVYFVFDF